MSATLLELKRDEFLVLLLIYASHADLQFTDIEKSKITQLYGDDLFDKMNELYLGLREYELLKTICEGRALFYPGIDGKEQVLDIIKGHFQSDGEYTRLERTHYNFLEKML